MKTQRTGTDTDSRLHRWNISSQDGSSPLTLLGMLCARPGMQERRATSLGAWGGPSTRIWKWGGGFESLLNGFSIGPSAHLDPGWKADVAIYPHLPQTQLSAGPHPELQGDVSLPGRNTGDDQEEAEQSGVLFFLTPPPF